MAVDYPVHALRARGVDALLQNVFKMFLYKIIFHLRTFFWGGRGGPPPPGPMGTTLLSVCLSSPLSHTLWPQYVRYRRTDDRRDRAVVVGGLRVDLMDVESRAEWRRRTRVADLSPEGSKPA